MKWLRRSPATPQPSEEVLSATQRQEMANFVAREVMPLVERAVNSAGRTDAAVRPFRIRSGDLGGVQIVGTLRTAREALLATLLHDAIRSADYVGRRVVVKTVAKGKPERFVDPDNLSSALENFRARQPGSLVVLKIRYEF